MFYDMTWLERVLWLKRIKGSGNPMHEATSTSGSFITDVVAPLKKLLLTLEPIQSGSGTPSPDNVRPISGHTEVVTEVCGKNIFDGTVENGKWIGDYTSGEAVNASSAYNVTDYISIKPNTSYYMMRTGSSRNIFYDINKNAIPMTSWAIDDSAKVITSPSNAYYIRFTITNAYLDTFSLNYPSTDHDYHPYQGHHYTTTLGRTVYGGTLDVVTGELVVDRAMVDLSTLSWSGSSGIKLSTGIANVVKAPSANNVPANIVAEKYATSAVAPISANDGKIGIEATGTTGRIQCGSSETPSGMLCYELATPQTYQLDPQQVNTLVGQNNIITEDGVEVSEIVYMTRIVGSPQTEEAEEPTEETDEPIEEIEEPEGE